MGGISLIFWTFQPAAASKIYGAAARGTPVLVVQACSLQFCQFQIWSFHAVLTMRAISADEQGRRA
jgi:hypothetical protein